MKKIFLAILMASVALTAFAGNPAPAILDAKDVTPACTLKESGGGGSLHARTIYEDTVFPPKTKTQQHLVCDDRPVSVYFLDYGSEQEAQSYRGYVGARLWGSGGPSDVHPDVLLIRGSVLAIASSEHPETLVKILQKKGFVLIPSIP
jgi:hypothetical protein